MYGGLNRQLETYWRIAVIGADIHGVLQHKEKGRWQTKEILDFDRNYELFGILAGVRSSRKPIAPQRGLPKDFSIIIQKTYYHIPPDTFKYEKDPYGIVGELKSEPGIYMGDHSHTWLTLDEIQKYNWTKAVEREDVWVPEKLKDLIFFSRNLKNWRVVLGFDS